MSATSSLVPPVPMIPEISWVRCLGCEVFYHDPIWGKQKAQYRDYSLTTRRMMPKKEEKLSVMACE